MSTVLKDCFYLFLGAGSCESGGGGVELETGVVMSMGLRESIKGLFLATVYV
jgi:hypothetical protein